MERQNRKSQILNILAKSVRRVVEEDVPDFDDLQEIRLRAGKPLMVIYRNREMVLPAESRQHITTKEEIRETMEYISHYSLYAYENELKQGFLTVEGGHRVGVSGKVIVEKEKVKNIQYISSVNIRMSHEVIGCADALLPYITKNMQVCHTLIISGGYLAGAHIGGLIGQALGFELPVVGYLLGSLIGTSFCVMYNIGKKKLISFCIDTGFTCFGLVEQNYELPDDVLHEIGVETISIPRTKIERTEIPRTQPLATGLSKARYETIDITVLRRGVVGINKVGYVLA